MEQYPDSYYVASLNKDKKSYASLNGELSCDLCVVGGGFTGLSTAIEAAKKGLDVICSEIFSVCRLFYHKLIIPFF